MRIYMMERFLERLAQSEYRDNFIIKGGILVTAMIGVAHRSTMDIDTSMKNLNLSAEDALRVVNQVKDKERFRNTLKRLKSGSNIARYNTICTLTQNDDEQRVWAICREFWGNNEAPLNIENYDVKDLDAAYAKRLLNELESLLDKLGWAKE